MTFIRLSEEYLDEYLAACQESHDHGVTEWLPVEPARFDAWRAQALRLYAMLESGEGLPAGVPRMLTTWCVEDGTFIGEVQIRPWLSPEGACAMGHIGYAVRYGRWGRGYGGRLLQYAVEQLRERGVSPIYLACHADNAASNRLARKVGFALAERRESADGAENLYVLA